MFDGKLKPRAGYSRLVTDTQVPPQLAGGFCFLSAQEDVSLLPRTIKDFKIKSSRRAVKYLVTRGSHLNGRHSGLEDAILCC